MPGVIAFDTTIAIGIVAGISACGAARKVDSLSESVQQESSRQTKVA